MVLADKAYDADKIIEYVTVKSVAVVIPTRNNRTIKREYNNVQLAATLIIIPKFATIV